MTVDAYGRRLDALRAALRRAPDGSGAPLGLAKRTSNLFRDRSEGAKRRLDLSAFTHVNRVDAAAGTVEVEGLATYETLVDATLPHGVMPAVVPQLKTITVGGAVAGVGIEATSFRHGLAHDTMLALDVLLPRGDIVTCTPYNEHRDLFYGFANSYGTLGYALRLVMRTIPVQPYVRVEHARYGSADAFFDALALACDGDADFVDGVVFGGDTLVLSTGRFAARAERVSDYTYEHIYYRSLLEKRVDYLSTYGYLWRWDTDWFWCSKNLGAQHPLLRRLYGRSRLNSRTYTRLMRLNSRLGLTRGLARWRGVHTESVIQDVDVPIAEAGRFLEFLLREIGVLPIWVCPIRVPGSQGSFTLYPVRPGELYVNFGFWDVVESRAAHPVGYYNRLIEREVLRCGGIKSLYSDVYMTWEEFEGAYGMGAYAGLKARYDPGGEMLGLYEKCVGRG
ncbi:FAD-binding oxidoreductase [Bordetella genomosp. 11]|uniref:Delta(24)-sterol reductase n=1 Tax=Bordetella genomosp. 11 TaxID=1416808 RepID=A0A261UXV1_9BORD|nr:FAD-binding oxidoreductase [Bordetella genomosp. 11]OZI66397.1 FAD-linked oxidase [Bordetella genomosp. 11]